MAAQRILVTGSTGNLGAKAVAAIAEAGCGDILRVGRNSAGVPGVVGANLEHYDPAWVRHFEGMDAVLHLAADPRAAAGWDTLAPLNIDVSLNVLRAAEASGVRRFIFASSNWVLGGYRFRADTLRADTPPWPINPYGASKLFVERAGRAIGAKGAMSFLALRIGYCQPGDNRPGPHMAFGLWGQEMWLGNRDWQQAVVRSVTASFEGAALVNVVSDNEGMRWDLQEARTAIGYVPTERHRPVLSTAGRLKDAAARWRERILPQGAPAAPFGQRW